MLIAFSKVVPDYSLGFRVVFRPDPLELIQVMGPKNGPITGKIVEVIHDDSYEKVDDLKKETNIAFYNTIFHYSGSFESVLTHFWQ